MDGFQALQHELQSLTDHFQALQRELRSLQSEITTLSGQAQDLLSRSSTESHGLIQESLTNLNQRVSILEKQAVSRSDELRQAQHLWQQYHDDVRTLRSRMQELQTTVMGPPTTSTATLDSLVSNINVSLGRFLCCAFHSTCLRINSLKILQKLLWYAMCSVLLEFCL